MVDFIYKPIQSSKSEDLQPSKQKIPFESLCYLYGKRITKQGSNGNTADHTDLYAVPDGKVFFLFSANLGLWTIDTGSSWGRLMWRPASVTSPSTDRTLLHVESRSANSVTASLSLAKPMLFFPGEILTIYNVDTDGDTNGNITGYEIDQTLYYQNV